MMSQTAPEVTKEFKALVEEWRSVCGKPVHFLESGSGRSVGQRERGNESKNEGGRKTEG